MFLPLVCGYLVSDRLRVTVVSVCDGYQTILYDVHLYSLITLSDSIIKCREITIQSEIHLVSDILQKLDIVSKETIFKSELRHLYLAF